MHSCHKAVQVAREHRPQKPIKAGLADVFLGSNILTGRPSGRYFLVRSRDGGPLDPRALHLGHGKVISGSGSSKHSKSSSKSSSKKSSKDGKEKTSSTDGKERAGSTDGKEEADSKAGKEKAGSTDGKEKAGSKAEENKPAPEDTKDKTEDTKKDEPPTDTAKVDVQDQTSSKEEAKKEEDKPADKTDAKPDVDAWTPEQDAKLKDMKAAGNTHKQISQAVGKPKGAVGRRWKEINPDGAATPANAGKEGSKDGDKSKGKHAEKESKKPDKEKSKAPSVEAEKSPSRAISVISARPHFKEPKLTLSALTALLAEDGGLYSASEVAALWGLLDEDNQDRWLRIASRFYDMTGRRVHEDDIKRKVKLIVSKV